jgi:predicted nucleotidyltransferase
LRRLRLFRTLPSLHFQLAAIQRESRQTPCRRPSRCALIQQETFVSADEYVQWQKISYDLHGLVAQATEQFQLKAIYLFGSRRFKTLSLRSDIDVFFVPESYIKPSDLRRFRDETCLALDIFLLEHGRATSAVNESYIQLDDDDTVIKVTRAVKLWSKEDGNSTDPDISWIQEYADHVNFRDTILPNFPLVRSLESLKTRLDQQGLPTAPVIGEDEEEIARRLIETARVTATFRLADFPGKGSARGSFVVAPQSEYDFQDLFWIATKPWIGQAARERVEIVFDGQKKKSDFSLMHSRFIVEMKFAKDKDDAREIAKTLAGLADFYRQHPNVRILLFIVYARKDAKIDKTAWEASFSRASEPRVIVSVIEVA